MCQDDVSTVFAALADSTRRHILMDLSTLGERSATALAEPFQISQPAISRHLRVLEEANLINRRKVGRVHLIRLRQDSLMPAQDWIAHCVAGWNYSFDQLDALLRKEGED
jgi:DNA-binding transcriptional ArsR family regulator